jgi:hypothetical protein
MELGAAGRIHRPWSPLQACRQPASASAASRLVAWWASVTSGNTSGWGDSGSTSSRSSSRSDGSVGFAVVPRPSAGSPTATTARSRVGIRLRGWGVRMLLATTAGADHLGPLVTFGAACHRFGHDVVVAAPESFAVAVESCTFCQTTIEFRPTLQCQRDDAATKGQVRRQRIFHRLLARLDTQAS